MVLDASAALAWILPSQSTDVATAFLDGGDSLVFEAPAIFEWEVRNVLLSMARRGLLADQQYNKALAARANLDVRLIAPTAEVSELAALAREVGLGLFDVSYFALALDRGWALASRDRDLLTVAALSGIDCFDLRSAT